MDRRRRLRKASNWFALLCGLYLGTAYFVLPAFWTWRDRGLGAGHEMVTRTRQGILGDPINVGLVGSRTDVIHAFEVAKWDPADAVTLKTAIEIGESVLLDRSYPDAPVSPLLFEGRPQDLAFEKPVGVSSELATLATIGPSCSLASRAAIQAGSARKAVQRASRSASDSQASM